MTEKPFPTALTEAECLEKIEALNEAENFAGILDFIHSLPDELRTPEIVGQEAKALGNIGQVGETDPYIRSVELLDSVPEEFRENHCWHFRRAYALYYLDCPIESRPHWQKALEHRPGDEDTLAFIDRTEHDCAVQIFWHPFKERVEDFWKAFTAEEAAFAQHIAEGVLGTKMAIERVRELLKIIQNDKWELGIVAPRPDDPRIRIEFSPQAWRVTAFPMAELVRRAPQALLDRWAFAFGRKALDPEAFAKVEIDLGTLVLRPKDIYVKPIYEEHAWRLLFTGEQLATFSEDDLPKIFEMLEALLRFSVGEPTQMHWFNRFGIRRWNPYDKKENDLTDAMRFTDFAEWAHRTIPETLTHTMDAELSEMVTAREAPNKDPDCDLLIDAVSISTCVPQLINEYRSNEKAVSVELEHQGVAAGFLYFTLHDGATAEEKAAARDALMAHLRDNVGPDIVRVTGFGSALRYEYVECFLWDSREVFNAAQAWFKAREDIVSASWHNFVRDGGGAWLKNPNPPEAPDDEKPETNDSDDSNASGESHEESAAAEGAEGTQTAAATSGEGTSVEGSDDKKDAAPHVVDLGITAKA